MPQTRVKTAPWIFGLLAFCVAFSAFGVAVLSAGAQDAVFWGLVVLLVLFALALLAAALSRVEDGGDVIRIVSGLRKTTIAKTAIEKAAWEKGSGVFLGLNDGSVVKLPALGRDAQRVVNTLRSWLRRSG